MSTPQNQPQMTPTEPSPTDADRPVVVGPLAHLPNALTIARLVFAMAFFVCLSVYRFPSQNAWALWAVIVLFIVAALTDAADGFLARRWRVITLFGRIFDPFADKFLILGAFILLAGPQFSIVDEHGGSVQATGVLPWMVIAILSRELLVTTIRGACESRGIDFSATFSGKLKMIVQSIAVPLILLNTAGIADALVHSIPGEQRLNIVLAWIVVVVTIWSAVPYTIRGMRGLRAHEAAQASGRDGATDG